MKRFALLVVSFLSTSGSARAEEAKFNGWTRDQGREEMVQCLAGAVGAGLDQDIGAELCICVVSKVVETFKPMEVSKMKSTKDPKFNKFIEDVMITCIAGPQT